MSYIDASQLTQMRADALATLADDTATILRGTAAVNAIGEWTTTYGTIAASVACRLRPIERAASLQLIGEQQQTVAEWVVTLPQGTALYPDDRLVIDSVTYEVMQTWDEETWDTATRANVKRLEA